MSPLPSRLLVVTDRSLARQPLEHVVAQALQGGARRIWYRDKDLPQAERRALGERLVHLCSGAGAVLSVGGEAEEAIAMGASALHLPAGGDPQKARAILGAGALIGVSAHSIEEVAIAASLGADYVTLSPVYESASKPGYGPPLGVCALSAARQLAVPVVALGGVGPDRVGECLSAGASGVAVMGAVMSAYCMRTAVGAFLARLTSLQKDPHLMRGVCANGADEKINECHEAAQRDAEPKTRPMHRTGDDHAPAALVGLGRRACRAKRDDDTSS